MTEPLQKETLAPAEKADTISTLLEERDRLPAQDQARLPDPGAEGTPESTPDGTPEDKPNVSQAIAVATAEAKTEEATQDPVPSSEVKALQEELIKSRKAITDTQKFGHHKARQLKNALKITQELVTNGSLSQEEAQSLVESLGKDDHETEADVSPYESHPFAPVLKIANAELATLRKYSDDDLLDEKVKAFDYFLNLAPLEDIQEALDDLTELSDEPIKLTKKMLAIGQHYYDTGYKDIKAAGGVFAYIDKKNQDIDQLHKTIDKLNKKLSQYEDFDKPRYRIAETGNGVGDSDRIQDTMTALFEERDKVRRR